ncbi:hypothetical protein AArc1_0577 [Natrarchaeobaculum sulfurireducens]|uniref:Uncharacterized protein n=2 Tax=Natrarchaeobaculum sulfurireducens TaxID=2044521 RepID=A0A346PBM6_9EURY|nr:hypothetical protein AArc1_0577 [Natrarchaeobaculum sulfurireducens]
MVAHRISSMGRLGTLVLKGLGLLVLAFIVLSVLATIVGIAINVVMAIVSIVVSLAVLGLVVVGIAWLFSELTADDDSTAEYDTFDRVEDNRDPKARLQERYVAGELTDAEFERELDRVMQSGDAIDRSEHSDVTRSRDVERDRSRR